MNAKDLDFLGQMVADRDAALGSLDEAQIRSYAAKYCVAGWMTDDPLLFWAGVHFSRTHLVNLPMADRTLSKRWLQEHKAFRLLARVPAEVPS